MFSLADTLYTVPTRPNLESVTVSRFEAMLVSMEHQILQHFFAFWEINDLITLSYLSSWLRGVYKRYQSDVWNIDRFLGSWFPDASGFRRVMRSTGAVISGSQVLQFFDRVRYIDSDLDIFLGVGGSMEMGRYFEKDGYRFEGQSALYPCFTDFLIRTLSRVDSFERFFENYIVGVYNFSRFVVSSGNVARRMHVQMIVLKKEPIRQILCGFHSSTSPI